MKSLRLFSLEPCRLRTVPFFSSELESLEALDLSWNNSQIDAPLDFDRALPPTAAGEAVQKGPRWPLGVSWIAGAPRSLRSEAARAKPGRQSGF